MDSNHRPLACKCRFTVERAVEVAAQAARCQAEAAAAGAAGDHERADRHEKIAGGSRALDDWYARIEDMDAEIMEHRAAWARVTEGSRHLAVMADAELRRRYPDADLDPLRSAEPAEPSPTVPDTADPQMTSRLAEHQQTVSEFRARLEERQGVMIPAVDPDAGFDTEAWPSPWEPWNRDAVLKPPKPEIRPAQPVLDRFADYEAGQ